MDLTEILGCDAEHLVQKVKVVNKDKIEYPCLVQQKYDGVFCIAYNDKINKKCLIFSRTGKQYTSMQHIEKDMENLFRLYDIDLILFEAYILDTPQSIISGYCRDTVNQHKELVAICHDCLTLNEWKGIIKTPYSNRYERPKYMRADKHNLYYPNGICAYNLNEIIFYASESWKAGGEGVVIKKINASYERGKRNWSLMKLKQEISYDLRIVDVEEGSGQFKDAVGALICKFKDSNISIGSGLTSEERKLWWKHKNFIVGHIAEIKAMRISSKGVLREPVFKGIRYDKDKADFE